MRPLRLGERQAGIDARMKVAGSEHVDKGAHPGTTLLDEVVPGVDGELPHRRRVLAQAQRRLQIVLRLATKGTVEDEHAARREQPNVIGDGRSRNRIDDNIDDSVAGDLLDSLADFFGLSVNNVICPKIAGKPRLLVAADHADDNKVCRLCEVYQRIAHSAGGSINEHALTLPLAHRIIENVVRYLVVGECSRGVEGDGIRQEKGGICRSRDEFCIMPAAVWSLAGAGVNALADPSRGDPSTVLSRWCL